MIEIDLTACCTDSWTIVSPPAPAVVAYDHERDEASPGNAPGGTVKLQSFFFRASGPGQAVLLFTEEQSGQTGTLPGAPFRVVVRVG